MINTGLEQCVNWVSGNLAPGGKVAAGNQSGLISKKVVLTAGPDLQNV